MRKLNRLHLLPGLMLLALAVPFAPAVPAALASTTGTATITVVAPGAAMGQAVEVQWGDPLGGWHRVDGWAGTFQNITPQGEAFARWTVLSGNYGQQPFRWVVYNPDGQTLWAVGPWFELPTFDGQDVAQRLDRGEGVPAGAPTPVAPTPVIPVTPTLPTPVVSGARVLTAHTFTYGLPCFGNCGDSKISALIGGLPSSIWITVQWQDGFGGWHTVDGWQGMASSVDANGVLFQQWDISPDLFDRGPFRWALYTFQGGSLIGVSPSFNMPALGQLNLYMSMAAH